ncbi:hypothetical protein [Limnohabitans sp.]|uniref:hypothetical protein n=1 Tax=Limnohabitans sp. TaxID=1907725 RepID=UPI0026224F8E|nr:hypothetical protein [Limnohabitans sp.]
MAKKQAAVNLETISTCKAKRGSAGAGCPKMWDAFERHQQAVTHWKLVMLPGCANSITHCRFGTRLSLQRGTELAVDV